MIWYESMRVAQQINGRLHYSWRWFFVWWLYYDGAAAVVSDKTHTPKHASTVEWHREPKAKCSVYFEKSYAYIRICIIRLELTLHNFLLMLLIFLPFLLLHFSLVVVAAVVKSDGVCNFKVGVVVAREHRVRVWLCMKCVWFVFEFVSAYFGALTLASISVLLLWLPVVCCCCCWCCLLLCVCSLFT